MATYQSSAISANRYDSRSAYMDFAKQRSGAKYNLATSGMASLPLSELHMSIDQLEIDGPNAYGYEPLKQAIARRYRVPADCVATALGTSMANYFAMATCANPGDEVLIEEPTYGLLLDTARYLGLEIKRFARPASANFQIDLDDFRRKISSRTRLVTLCNMHNPSGALVDDNAMHEVGAMAKKVGARVIVDEVYREMLWEAEPRSAFHIDPEVFLSTNSLTKAYGLSGIRCGWILASAEIVERVWHLNDLHAGINVFPADVMGVVAFEQLGRIAELQKKRLNENRRLLRECLESQSALDYVWPEHGTVVFPRVKNGDAERLCERLRREYELTVVPGGFFEDDQRIRIGVGGKTEEVRGSLLQLGKALSHLA